jgi:hypothetical protein
LRVKGLQPTVLAAAIATVSPPAWGQAAEQPPAPPVAAQPPTEARPPAAPQRAREHRRRPRSPSQPWRKRKDHHPNAVAKTQGPRSVKFVLSVERITSVLHWTTRGRAEVTMGVSTGSSGTDISLLGGGSAVNANPFATPRLAFDALYGNFTAGGSLIYLFSSTTLGDGSVTIVTPRLGALFPRSGVVRGWLRGGISYVSASSDVVGASIEGQKVEVGEAQLTVVDLTLEPLLVLMPSDQVGITFGPTLDIGLGGGGEFVANPAFGFQSRSVPDYRASSYGASAGLLIVF